jgi:hypothetical protein
MISNPKFRAWLTTLREKESLFEAAHAVDVRVLHRHRLDG